jgi:ABC-type Na+ efflux pump permease subunit
MSEATLGQNLEQKPAVENGVLLESPGESSIAVRPNLEQVTAPEKDEKGVVYVVNMICMFLLFGISMIIIAWFGLFSEV